MKLLPVVIVLGAFGVLLLLTRPTTKSGQPGDTTVAAAQQSGASVAHGATPKQEAASHGKPAPAASNAPAAARSPQGADSGKAVEPVKAPAAKAPSPKKPDTIVGDVRDASGATRSQIVVMLIGADGKEVARQTTGDDGRFTFENVAAGSYTLATYDPDYLYTARAQAAATVRKGATTEASLRVDRGTSGIRGIVVDGMRKPMADRKVVLTAGGAKLSVNTDPKGLFVVNGLVPGSWRVGVEGFDGSERTVAVKADATSDVAFELARAATLEFALAGSPLHPLEIDGRERVWLRKAGDAEGKPLETALHGDYHEASDGHHATTVGKASFANLAPGEYEIEVVDPTISDPKRMSLLHVGEPWTVSFPITLREGEERLVSLPSAKAALGSGVTVPTWAIILMWVVIGALVIVTPILFPAPLAPKRPATMPAKGAATVPATGPAAAH